MSPPPKKAGLKVQIDGAARGNPGPAGAGVVLFDPKGKKVRELSVYLGPTTNNVAETCALVIALQEVLLLGERRVDVLTDSELLARQVSGDYRVRDAQLQTLHALIRHLVSGLEDFSIRHIPREENRAADRLANRAVEDGLRESVPSRRKSKQTPAVSPDQPTLF